MNDLVIEFNLSSDKVIDIKYKIAKIIGGDGVCISTGGNRIFISADKINKCSAEEILSVRALILFYGGRIV